MPALVRRLAILCLTLAVACAALFSLAGQDPWLTLAITFGTAAYHLGIRLLVGRAYDRSEEHTSELQSQR